MKTTKEKVIGFIRAIMVVAASCSLFLTPIAAEGDGSDTITVGTVTEIAEAQKKGETSNQSTSAPKNRSTGVTTPTPTPSAGTTLQQTVSNTYTDSRLNIEHELNGYIDTDTEMDDFFNRLIAKEYAIMNGFQRAALPWCFGSFIVGSLMLIWGAVSKRVSVMPGIWTMIISGIAYTCIIYGPAILNYFSRFLSE